MKNFQTADGVKIAPKEIRFGTRTTKGYELSQFADAFARYLPPDSPFPTATSATCLISNDNLAILTATDKNDVAVENAEKTNEIKGVADVAVENLREGKDDDDDNSDSQPWELNL